MRLQGLAHSIVNGTLILSLNTEKENYGRAHARLYDKEILLYSTVSLYMTRSRPWSLMDS